MVFPALTLGSPAPARPDYDTSSNHDRSRSEMGGKFWYWGGHSDLASNVEKLLPGRRVMTAAVGPFSSAWDRACELYAQIKGGLVHYGAVHAARHGHAKYGRESQGLYPEWDREHPIHLIGHSFGGTTARVLVQLLSDGGASMGEDDHVFGGGTSAEWILSVTTIATPHDGTPMITLLDTWMGAIFNSLGMAAGVAGVSDSSGAVYDFKLEQWGVAARDKSEPWGAYTARVRAAPLWKDHERNRDLIHHDLSPEGAAEVNSWVQDSPLVLYVSYETLSSSPDPFSSIGNEIPHLSTNPMFVASGVILGRVDECGNARRPTMSREWRRNDGMVSCRLPFHALERRYPCPVS